MNRRNFLKRTGQSLLVGLFGGFLVSEKIKEFTEQREVEKTNSEFSGVDVANGEDLTGVVYRSTQNGTVWFEHSGITNFDEQMEWYQKIIALGMSIETEKISNTNNWDKLSDEALLNFEEEI